MYEYSKSNKNKIMCKKYKIYSKGNTLEPVKNKTSIKYRSTNRTQVNSKVLCTGCVSTKYVAYTWQLTKDEAERGYEGRHSVMYVCNVIAENTVINTCKYSTSDITEMAEKNGQMDVDPEGLMLYGPYGKSKIIIYALVLYVNITQMMLNVPKKEVYKYSDPGDESVSVWCKKCKYVKIDVYKYSDPVDESVSVWCKKCKNVKIDIGKVCGSPESVVTKEWSARSKTVEIQSGNWHKEYGE